MPAASYLLLTGLLSVALYFWGISARFPLMAGLERGRASWATLGDRTPGAGLTLAVVYTLLMLLYMLAGNLLARTARRAPQTVSASIPLIWLGWLCASVVLLGAYPGESLDIFDYLFRGRMLVEHGSSPLAVAPWRFREQPFYNYITWRTVVDTYGPIWEYASAAVAWSTGQLLGESPPANSTTLAAYLLGYRLFALAASGLCGGLILAIVRQAAPTAAPLALLVWLWNPLQLVASAVGAHNDLLMIALILAGCYLLQRQRWWLGLLVLLLAAHVKLTALLLLPVAGLWLVGRIGWRAAIMHSLLALGLCLPISWLLYAPLGGWDTLPRMLNERVRFLIGSPADLLYRALREQAGWRERNARQLATTLASGLYCIVLLPWLLGQLWPAPRRRPAPDNALLWRSMAASMTIYLCIGSFWFMPWYVLWVLPLTALLPETGWARVWAPLLSLTALWHGLTADTLIFLKPQPFTATQASWFSVIVMWLPILLAATLLWIRRASQKAGAARLTQLNSGQP